MKKYLFKIAIPLCFVILIFTTSMVAATWEYSGGGNLQLNSDFISIGLSSINYQPEQTLPGTEQDSANGVNQLELIHTLSSDVKNGLNSNKRTLEKLVINNGLAYSEENVQGGNLKNLFSSSAVTNLEFVMQYSSNTEIFCYTFIDDDRSAATEDVTKITVYKTVYKKNGNTWEDVYAYKGYATVVYVTKINNKSIDPLSWREGEIPQQ